jgi:DNA-binding response OmpR family regulator
MSPRACNVLIVEDEWILADLISCALGDAGYEIVGPSADVSDALHRLREKPVDVAILDVHLGDENSFEVAQELMNRRIGFAFLSGYSSKDIPARFGSVPLLRKPARIDEICATIKSLLEEPKTRGARNAS